MPVDANSDFNSREWLNPLVAKLENYAEMRFHKFGGKNLWLYFLANPVKLSMSELNAWEKLILDFSAQINIENKQDLLKTYKWLVDDLNDIRDLKMLLENPNDYDLAQLAYNEMFDRLQNARVTDLNDAENFWQKYLAGELAEGDDIYELIAIYQDNLDLYQNMLKEIYHYNLTVTDRSKTVVIPANHWIYDDMRDFAIIIEDLHRQAHQVEVTVPTEQSRASSPQQNADPTDDYEEELYRFISKITPVQQQTREEVLKELESAYQELFKQTPNGVWAEYSKSPLLKIGAQGREALRERMHDLEEQYLPLINKVKQFNLSVSSEQMIDLAELHPKFLQAVNDFAKVEDDLFRLEQHAALPQIFWKIPDPEAIQPTWKELSPRMEATRNRLLSQLNELHAIDFPPPIPSDSKGKMDLVTDIKYQLDYYEELEAKILKFNAPIEPSDKINLEKDHAWFYEEIKRLKLLQNDLYRNIYSDAKGNESSEEPSPQKKF